MTQPWVMATRNAGKLRELAAFFAARGVDVVDLQDVGIAEDASAEDAIESHDTFEENALAKARYFSARLPGRLVVADDSGLSVSALGGAPGVRSKRWSEGERIASGDLVGANNARLVRELSGVTLREASFVCAAAACADGSEVIVRGEVLGRIVDVARGTNGFGYDPHFFVDELAMTLAEASLGEKERVSHRARAFQRLLDTVRETPRLINAGVLPSGS